MDEIREKRVPLVIGLDLGTTNCKAIAVTPSGQVCAQSAASYSLHSPNPGWAVQETEDIWQGVVQVLDDLESQVQNEHIAGLCLSGAMHSLLLVNEAGEPLAPAMTWADQRADSQALNLRRQVDTQALYQRTGCPLQPLFHLPKIRWWHDEEPKLIQQAALFIAIKDWVLFNLTGQWITDFGVASASGLLNIHDFVWDEEALSLASIKPDGLPELISPISIIGKVAPHDTPFYDVPVIAGSGDGGLANLGAGTYLPGQCTISVGTSGAVRIIVDNPWLDPLERTWCYALMEGKWYAGGAINNAGLALQWVCERFYPDLTTAQGYRQIFEDASGIHSGAEGLLFLPYFTGERNPHWNPSARALLYGLGLEHSRAHIARAVLEGIAFCLADVWDVLPHTERKEEPVRLTGGLARSPLFCQILANVLNTSLVMADVQEASALGAAMLGHHALGNSTLEQMAKNVIFGIVIEPDPQQHAMYAELHRDFKKMNDLISQEIN